MPRKSNATIPFNSEAVRKVATTKHEAQAEYPINGVPGLRLICLPSGAASYAVRITVKGKRRREVLGLWNVITLGDARLKAFEVAAGVADDRDILADEKKEKGKVTLQQLWQQRKESQKDRSENTMDEYERMLTADVWPTLGKRPATDITPDEFADLLDKVESRSKHAARLLKAAISSTYSWGRKRRLVRVNPLAGLGFSELGRARRRVLTDEEMKKLWLAIGTTKGLTEPMRNILRLAILTGQRNGEVAGMQCSELVGLDSSTPRWDIPAHRMKRKSEDQHVPLSRQAAEIARDALKVATNGVHLFEGAPNGRRKGTWRQEHVGQESVSRAMAKVVATAKLKDVRLHDMRKCITSWLAEHGHASSEVLDTILHHGKKGVTGSHYNFALYEKQVRAALQVWADHISHLTNNGASQSSDNVVQMARANG
jgi:integrase